jgi:hypothetical protein
MDPTISALIGAAIGAIAGVAGTIVTTIISKRSDERQQIRDLAVRTALENWKNIASEAQRQADAGFNVTMQPLDGYIVHASKLLAICAEKNLTPERAESLMREVYAVGSSAQTVIDEHNQKQEAQQAASSNPLEHRS